MTSPTSCKVMVQTEFFVYFVVLCDFVTSKIPPLNKHDKEVGLVLFQLNDYIQVDLRC